MADPEPIPSVLAEGPDGDRPMSFFEHLAELRKRLIHATIGITLAFALAWVFRMDLQAIINAPLYDAWQKLAAQGLLQGEPHLQTLGVLDAFLTQVRIAVTGALFLAAPILFYELWMFVAPGLYPSEKRLVVPFVATSAVMFALGAVFCYQAVLPYATEWFLKYPLEDSDGSGVMVIPQYTFPDYTTYTTKLLIGFGLMFEMPLAVFFLAKAGLVTHRTLLRFWKVAVLLIFVASALLTPPDPITLTFMAMPMTALFFISVGLAYMVTRSAPTTETGLVPADPGARDGRPGGEPAAGDDGSTGEPAAGSTGTQGSAGPSDGDP